MKYWEKKEKLYKYTEGVRQYFPLAHEQLDIIARIINKFNPEMQTFLDLGCGDGFLGNFIYGIYPESKGVFTDVSEEMIRKTKARKFKNRSEFIVQDFEEVNWFKSIKSVKEFDVIISGFSIHHIENKIKKRLYHDIYNLLKPNGIFLNLEHVSSPTESLEELFNDLFLDGMINYQESKGDTRTKEEIKGLYHDPEHKKLNKLESVEKQCECLRSIGFSEVDCYLKIFEMALFGGVKR